MCKINLALAFCEFDEILELPASRWHHWTAEILTVKMISSSRLKPHGTGWSRYMLLSPSLHRRWRRAARTRHIAAL